VSFLLLDLARETKMADLDGDRVAGLQKQMGCDTCRFVSSDRKGDKYCQNVEGWQPLWGTMRCMNQRSKADLS
jgi:hypothetical protein